MFEAVVLARRRRSAFNRALISRPSERAVAWESIPFRRSSARLSTIFHVSSVIHLLAGRSLGGGANYILLELLVRCIQLRAWAPG
jgi:hypothetical protein